MRAADAAHRVRAAILLVVGVQDEQHVERVLQNAIRFVLHLGHLEHHVQEVAGIAQIIVGIVVGHSHAVTIGKRGQGRHLGYQPVYLMAARLRVEDVLGILVERGQRSNRADQHPHRMRVVVERIHGFLDLLVNECVVSDVPGPFLQLTGRRQLSMQKQVCNFKVGAAFGELLDRISAIAQDAFVAVDEGDAALARGGIHKRRIVAHQPEVIV